MTELIPHIIEPRFNTPHCEFYRVNSMDFHLIKRQYPNDKFKTFANGFKLLFIHEGLEIRHVYIDDSELKHKANEQELSRIVSYLLNGHRRCLYVITSDIHLQYFHLRLITKFAEDTRIGHVIINGDVFYRRLCFLCDESSRIPITDQFINFINVKLLPLLILKKAYWIRGNHDIEKAWAHKQLVHKPLNWPIIDKLEFNISGKKFIVQHEMPELISEYDYIIVGHSCNYMITDEMRHKYTTELCTNIYINNFHDCFIIDPETYKEDGEYTIPYCNMSFTRKGYEFTFKCNERIQTIDMSINGPVNISMRAVHSKVKDPVKYNRERIGFIIIDLIYQSEMSRIRSNSHIICTNNFRLGAPFKPDSDKWDSPVFKSYGF